MKQIISFAILVIAGASAQPLLFSREDPEPYKGHAFDIEDAEDQPTVMKPETAAVPVDLTSVICPGGQYRCPDGMTCCKQSEGKWGCCPYSQAVCCSDKKHCCPQGKTCDLSSGTCRGRDSETPWMAKESAIRLGVMAEQKAPLVVSEGSRNAAESREHLIQLVSMAASSRVKDVPCGRSHCPDSYPVCCIDGHHCCPAGTQCIIGTSYCYKSYTQLNWMVKKSAGNIETAASVKQLEVTDIPVKGPAKLETIPENRDGGFVETFPVNQICPGGRRQCLNGLCCPMQTGGYGCCSDSNPVCCPDGRHCCPRGTTCNSASSLCIGGDQIFKPFRKIPAQQTP